MTTYYALGQLEQLRVKPTCFLWQVLQESDVRGTLCHLDSCSMLFHLSGLLLLLLPLALAAFWIPSFILQDPCLPQLGPAAQKHSSCTTGRVYIYIYSHIDEVESRTDCLSCWDFEIVLIERMWEVGKSMQIDATCVLLFVLVCRLSHQVSWPICPGPQKPKIESATWRPRAMYNSRCQGHRGVALLCTTGQCRFE